MSPIFNHHALHGLPTNALEHLRETLRQALGNADLQECERANLHAALASVEAVLRKRQVPPAPKPRAPSL
ncbi:hypothetical protein [Roseitranquillus sediminis]|uniref:hypothetical protein n=1 Tax=Roseitranquillus sediminis TaxID=2809051 RepID=UPI001D0CBE52|nr:hypothetical protein [Roseitranquillus sediminis]MBM9593933.1 hypothetical protein [Roseitranquillus sediminis]